MMKNTLAINSFLKIVSVVIAIIFWVIVTKRQVEEETLSIPIKLHNVPVGYVALPSVSNISVKIKGPTQLLNTLQYSSILLDIDVNTLPLGNSSRRLLIQDVKVPAGIEVLELIPKEILVTIDQEATAKTFIVPDVIGEVASGYILESVSVAPNFVDIEGPRSTIDTIDSVITYPINISSLNKNINFQIDVKKREGIKTIKPSKVSVLVKVRENIIERVLHDIPLTCGDLPAYLSLKHDIKLDTVLIEGRSDLVDSFEKKSRFFVDCSKISKPGSYLEPILYETSIRDVNVKNIHPQKIKIEIK